MRQTVQLFLLVSCSAWAQGAEPTPPPLTTVPLEAEPSVESAPAAGAPAYVANAVAYSVLAPGAIVDLVLLATSRFASPVFGALFGVDALGLALDTIFLITNLSRRERAERRVGPKGFSVWHAGASIGRSYCSRPGVTTCAEYDALSGTPPQGDIVNFRSGSDYLGRYLRAEVFPLAWTPITGLLQGFGVVASLGQGASLSRVVVESPSGPSLPKDVVSTDTVWDLQAAFRWYFSFNRESEHAGVGHVGLRGGAAGRVFDVDPTTQVPLTGSHRAYPIVGLDVAVPAYVKYVGVELSGSILVNPRPGAAEIMAYGDPAAANGGASSLGFEIEGGIGGVIWGPIGYRLHWRYTTFTDRFSGAGQKWAFTTNGAAAESYLTTLLGVTSSF